MHLLVFSDINLAVNLWFLNKMYSFAILSPNVIKMYILEPNLPL